MDSYGNGEGGELDKRTQEVEQKVEMKPKLENSGRKKL